jgi:hypothetical protein
LREVEIFNKGWENPGNLEENSVRSGKLGLFKFNLKLNLNQDSLTESETRKWIKFQDIFRYFENFPQLFSLNSPKLSAHSKMFRTQIFRKL